MFQIAQDNAILCTIFNILFGYGIYYTCALAISHIIIHEDIKYNPDYTYNDDYYFTLPTIIAIGVFAYVINFGQSLFMSIMYSRHYCGINIIIHHLMLIYIWISLSTISIDGCKHRKWLSCYKNETVVLNNNGIIYAKNISGHGIISLLVIEIVFSIYSYCKNRRVKYYFYENGFYEICAVVLFHYMIGIFYVLIPIVMWFCICLINVEDNDGIGNTNQSEMTIILKGLFNGNTIADKSDDIIHDISALEV